MRYKLLLALLAVAIVLAAVHFFPFWNAVKKPTTPPRQATIIDRIPHNSEYVFVIGDFPRLYQNFKKSSVLARVYDDPDLADLLESNGDASDEFRKMMKSFDRMFSQIEQIATFGHLGRAYTIIEFGDEGEIAFRDTLAFLAKTGACQMDFEGDSEAIYIGANKEFLAGVFKFYDNYFLMASTETELEMLYDKPPDGGFDLQLPDGVVHDLIGIHTDIATERRFQFFADLVDGFFDWHAELPLNLNAYPDAVPFPAPAPLAGDATIAISLDNAFFKVLYPNIGEAISAVGSSGAFLKKIFEMCNDLSANGAVSFWVPKGTIVTDYAISFPVRSEEEFLARMEELAEEKELTIGNNGKTPFVYYIKDKDMRIGPEIGGIKYWTVRNNYACLSPSQFTISKYMQDNCADLVASDEALYAFLSVDYRELTKMVAPMNIAFAMTGKKLPDWNRLAAMLGRDDMVLYYKDGFFARGRNTLPYGLLLHLSFAGYNMLDEQ